MDDIIIYCMILFIIMFLNSIIVVYIDPIYKKDRLTSIGKVIFWVMFCFSLVGIFVIVSTIFGYIMLKKEEN